MSFIKLYALSLAINFLTFSLRFLLSIPAVNVLLAIFFIAMLIWLLSWNFCKIGVGKENIITIRCKFLAIVQKSLIKISTYANWYFPFIFLAKLSRKRCGCASSSQNSSPRSDTVCRNFECNNDWFILTPK